MVKLPPEVTYEKRQREGGGWAFCFRHSILGDLGRVVMRDMPDGNCQLSMEIVGDPDDPVTEKRGIIFKPIGMALAAALEGRGASVEADIPPPCDVADPVLVENKLLQCNHCGVYVARLVFAPAATDEACFEDYARMLFPTFAEMDVPTWIIGHDLADGPGETRPADIMAVWPSRGPIRRLSPALFNPELDRLQDEHCRR